MMPDTLALSRTLIVETLGVATTGAHAGPVLSSVNRFIPCADFVPTAEGKIVPAFDGKHDASTAESKTWCMYGRV
jgi:hypothetical protein